MISKILGLWLNIKNPKTRFIVNVSIVFIVISFLYFIRYDSGIKIDLQLNGEYTEENLRKGRILSAVKHYGIVLLFAIWQYNKWIRKNHEETSEVALNEVQNKKGDTLNQTKETEPDIEIDPKKASFKKDKFVALERYIRTSNS